MLLMSLTVPVLVDTHTHRPVGYLSLWVPITGQWVYTCSRSHHVEGKVWVVRAEGGHDNDDVNDMTTVLLGLSCHHHHHHHHHQMR